jgi:uncharacterized protein
VIVNGALGFVVGIILALTGAGGGILAVPALVFGAHQGIAEAAPIGLLAVAMAAAFGAVIGLRAGIVRYRAAAVVSGVGMCVSPLGLWLAHRVDDAWLTLLFACVLLFVALRIFRQAGKRRADKTRRVALAPCLRNEATGRFVWTVPCARALAGSGALAGLLSGLIGVGGGFVMVPALSRFTDLDIKSIVATSLAIVALVSLAGVAASLAAGIMVWPVAVPFSSGAIIGMGTGRLIAGRLPGHYLQHLFAAVSIGVAIALIVRVLH